MNKDLVLHEPAIKRITVIHYGYEITEIPGWAFNAYLRMYYYIPEEIYMPSEEAWIICPELKIEKKPVPEKSYMHPNHKAKLSVLIIGLIAAGLAGFDAFYGFLTSGYKLILIVSLGYVAFGCMILLFTSPSESELYKWEREKRKKDLRNDG